jgi:uncharacterized protein (TIGR03545 family)
MWPTGSSHNRERTRMKLIRWKGVMPLIIVSALVVVFYVFFFDGMLRRSLISAGEEMFGAKVEIAKLKTDFARLAVSIEGVQVADRTNPWFNVVQVDRIGFAMRFLPLLEKKVVIDEMVLVGLRTGVKRATDGTLPPKRARQIEKKRSADKESFAGRLWDSVKSKAADEVGRLPAMQSAAEVERQLKNINISQLIESEKANLAAPKFIEQLSAETSAKYESYRREIDAVNVNQAVELSRQIVSDIQSIKVSGVQDVPAAQQKLNEINAKKETVEATLRKVDDLQKRLAAEYADKKDVADRIRRAVDEDYRALLNKVKLPEFNKAGIARALFGPMWIGRVDTVMGYLALARKYMPPPSKGSRKIVVTRAKGEDILFPRERSWPSFWIRTVKISGVLPSGLALSGDVTDVSTDHRLTGKPMIAALTGSQAPQFYQLKGIFDRTSEQPVDTILMTVSGIPVGDMSLGDIKYLPRIADAAVAMRSTFTMTGGSLDCALLLTMDRIRFEQRSPTGDFLADITAEVVSGLREVNVRARLHGAPESLAMELDSNIDETLSERIKQVYGRKVEEFKQEVRRQLNERISREREKLLALAEEKKRDLTASLDAYKRTLQERVDELKSTQEDKKKELENQGKKETQKQLDKLKDSDSLKNLFKR